MILWLCGKVDEQKEHTVDTGKRQRRSLRTSKIVLAKDISSIYPGKLSE